MNNSYSIMSQLNIGEYTLLETDREIVEHGSRYLIDGKEYEIVIVYDMPKHIAIKGTGDFVGKSCQCI